MFDSLTQALEQFDAAVEQGTQGRWAQVEASAELNTVVGEVVQVVKVTDGLNRLRFAKEAEALAAWASASNVLAAPPLSPPPKPAHEAPEEPSLAGGEIRPAA